MALAEGSFSWLDSGKIVKLTSEILCLSIEGSSFIDGTIMGSSFEVQLCTTQNDFDTFLSKFT